MNEDPVARRNRGGASGPWIVAALGLLVVALVAAVLLRPGPAPSAAEPEAAAVSMEQRVADDTADRQRREAARP